MNEFEQYKQLLNDSAGDLVYNEANIESKKIEERWTGIIVDNEDPQQLGRVQIRIIGFYDEIPDYLLPWAIPDITYLGSSRGSFIVPEINSIVRGYFDKGDIQKPIYDSLAFQQKNVERDTLGILDKSDYPHKMVLMETDQGDFLTLNRKTGQLIFTHRTGASTTIDALGNIFINAGIGLYNGGLNVDIQGDVNISSKGNLTINALNNVKIESVAGSIELGNNPEKQLINNIPQCFICGAMHTIGNTQVKV